MNRQKFNHIPLVLLLLPMVCISQACSEARNSPAFEDADVDSSFDGSDDADLGVDSDEAADSDVDGESDPDGDPDFDPDGHIDPEMFDTALGAFRWLQAHANVDGQMANWDEYIGDPPWDGQVAHPTTLYSGASGIALFLLEFAEVTGDADHRTSALDAGRWLADQAIETADGHYWESEVEHNGTFYTTSNSGLYDGIPGPALALLRLGQRFEEPSFVEIAESAAQWLMSQAHRDSGCHWMDYPPLINTDIIGGSAGIVVFFLEMYEATGDEQYLDNAQCAGDWLVSAANPEDIGVTWESMVGWDSVYTGFSHGVAGVSYALARLYEVSGDTTYLETAEAGADWLEHVAECDENGCRWFHYHPDGTDFHMTGWCHGPAGTSRLFLLLSRLTDNERYLELAEQGARWVIAETDPDVHGYVFFGLSFCCGAASIGEFFIDIYLQTGNGDYLDFARRVAQFLVDEAHESHGGLMWTNYDYPDKDGRLWYATGLKVGAAGVGWFFLRLATVDRPTPSMVIPDERL